MTSDSHLFLDQSTPDSLPLYEAKMIHQFDHRWSTYDRGQDGGLTLRDVTEDEKQDPDYVIEPRYCVATEQVEGRLSARSWTRDWLIGWRDICRATDERTVIATVIPRVGVGNKVPLMLPGDAVDAAAVACLLGNLDALVCDFAARQKVGGTTLNYFIYKQLAVLAANSYSSADRAFIVPRVLELTYVASCLGAWASDLAFRGPPFEWRQDRRRQLRAELDGYYACLYGLTRDELRYILDPADLMGMDYPSETFRVLKENEIREIGDYRTGELVLEAYDALIGGLPMASEARAIGDALAAPMPIRPNLTADEEMALLTMALVGAAGGSISLGELIRALTLRREPSRILASVPPHVLGRAHAWVGAAPPTEGASPASAIIQALVQGSALTSTLERGPDPRISAVEASSGNDFDPWLVHSTRLLLAVTRSLRAARLNAIESQLPTEDKRFVGAMHT
jgi:hypothetical protein